MTPPTATVDLVGTAGKGKKRSIRKRVRYSFRVLAPFARPHRAALAKGATGAMVVVACRLAFPWPLRGVMEITFQQGGRGAAVGQLIPGTGDPAPWLAGSFVLIVLVWALAEHLQRLALARFAAGTVRDAREAALARLQANPPDTGPHREAGDVIARVVGDSARLKSGLKGVLIGLTRNGAFFLGVATIVMLIDVPIGLVFLAGGLATIGVASVGLVRSGRLARRYRRNESMLVDRLYRHLAGSGRSESLVKNRPERGTTESTLTKLEGRVTMAIHVVLAATTCLILVLALDAGRTGRLSPGAVFTILVYVLLMHNKTVSLGRQTMRLGRVLASAERLAKVLVPSGAVNLPDQDRVDRSSTSSGS